MSLYPPLPGGGDDSHSFRLQKINEIKLFFQSEIEQRRKALKKYTRSLSYLPQFYRSDLE